jgi:hypothetical protein
MLTLVGRRPAVAMHYFANGFVKIDYTHWLSEFSASHIPADSAFSPVDVTGISPDVIA